MYLDRVGAIGQGGDISRIQFSSSTHLKEHTEIESTTCSLKTVDDTMLMLRMSDAKLYDKNMCCLLL